MVWIVLNISVYIDGLVQERRNPIANALELRLSCTNPSIWEMSRPLPVRSTVSLCVPLRLSVTLCDKQYVEPVSTSPTDLCVSNTAISTEW